MDEDKDYPPKSGILPQYAHLRGMHENLPVIRKLLGIPAYGNIGTDTAIGRAVQRCVENSSTYVLCKTGVDKYETVESG